MVPAVPVSSLRCGEVADVADMSGSPEVIRRLEELGIRHGARLEVLRGGSPCIVRVGGAKLCFRHDELLYVLVTPRMTA